MITNGYKGGNYTNGSPHEVIEYAVISTTASANLEEKNESETAF